MKTDKEHFIDWEGETFGFGYGTGEGEECHNPFWENAPNKTRATFVYG